MYFMYLSAHQKRAPYSVKWLWATIWARKFNSGPLVEPVSSTTEPSCPAPVFLLRLLYCHFTGFLEGVEINMNWKHVCVCVNVCCPFFFFITGFLGVGNGVHLLLLHTLFLTWVFAKKVSTLSVQISPQPYFVLLLKYFLLLFKSAFLWEH